ncbi:MAG: hypothetical protein KGL39_37760 [Patescibacteria group bacterium]|nr:hypothetical protein [Patescibacteria group bacterium]
MIDNTEAIKESLQLYADHGSASWPSASCFRVFAPDGSGSLDFTVCPDCVREYACEHLPLLDVDIVGDEESTAHDEWCDVHDGRCCGGSTTSAHHGCELCYSLKSFTDAYIDCALWSSVDDDGDPLDNNFSCNDLDADALSEMERDCANFERDNRDLLQEAYATVLHIPGQPHYSPANEPGDFYTPDMAGHDFWLTRNHHGAGFWDRGLSEYLGNLLTEAAKEEHEAYLFVNDDNTLAYSRSI